MKITKEKQNKVQLMLDYHKNMVVNVANVIKDNSNKVLDFDSPEAYQAEQLAHIETLKKLVNYLH